jgi:hypothetical protein
VAEHAKKNHPREELNFQQVSLAGPKVTFPNVRVSPSQAESYSLTPKHEALAGPNAEADSSSSYPHPSISSIPPPKESRPRSAGCADPFFSFLPFSLDPSRVLRTMPSPTPDSLPPRHLGPWVWSLSLSGRSLFSPTLQASARRRLGIGPTTRVSPEPLTQSNLAHCLVEKFAVAELWLWGIRPEA